MTLTQTQVFALARAGKLAARNLIADHSPAAARIDTYTPIDNTRIGQIDASSEADVDAAVKLARRSFASGEWSALAPAERKRIMIAWHALVQEHTEELAALDCIDAGKPISECVNTDLPATLETIAWYAEAASFPAGCPAPPAPWPCAFAHPAKHLRAPPCRRFER